MKMLIDTDTASDDAVALVLALTNPEVEVSAITVVAGNVPLDAGVQAALHTVERCGSSVPVHAGMAQPMIRVAPRTAQHVHGQDGMGDVGLDLQGRRPHDKHAVVAIIDAVRENPGQLTIVTLGPLSNLAMAIRMAPEIVPLIPHIVVMGGYARQLWGQSRHLEFNLMIDPEASAIVYESGIPLTQVGLDVSMLHATLEEADERRLRGCGPLGEFMVDIQAVLRGFCQEKLGIAGFTLPDPLAMAVAIAPEIVTDSVRTRVDIEVAGEHTAGLAVVDHSGASDQPANVDVVVDTDRDAFLAMLAAAASHAPATV